MNSYWEHARIENIRRWLESVDLTNANILEVERDIYQALYRSQNPSRWDYTPIAPYAEPVSMDDLVGDMFNGAQRELKFQAERVDNLYAWTNETNNLLKSELETVEGVINRASEAVKDITFITQNQDDQFYWVGDSFNTSTFTDSNSTALVDTDIGRITLAPSNLTAVDLFDVSVDSGATKGVPGCNLLILSLPNSSLPDKELSPVVETAPVKDVAAAFDGDPNSWFEIERNFVTPKQRVVRVGRSFKTDPNGKLEDVKKITKDYDWRIYVQWPNQGIDTGPDNKGVLVAEFKEIEKTASTSTTTTISPGNTSTDNDVRLAMDLTFTTPQVLSVLKLTPFLRTDQSPIEVEQILLYTGRQEIKIADNVQLSISSKSTDQLTKEILRRTGSQTVGAAYSIPTDQPIDKIRIVLRSRPYKTKLGLAHEFKENLTERKSTRKFLFVSSVDRSKYWERKPLNENPPLYRSEQHTPKLFGSSTVNSLLNLLALSELIQPPVYQQPPGTAPAFPQGPGVAQGTVIAQQVKAGSDIFGLLSKAGLGKTFGSIGSALGKAAPIIGGALVLNEVIKSAFGFSRSYKTLDQRTGYDVFEGYRAAIGLRDIEVLRLQYSGQSVFISTKRYFPGLINKVGLFVDEAIPDNWPPGEWISYSVSIDGQNWIPIPKLTDAIIDRFVELPEPTSGLYFRAILKGNSEDIHHSPETRHYTLRGYPVA